jgi:hypothetical protein
MRRFLYAFLIAFVAFFMVTACVNMGANKSATAQLAEQDASAADMAKAAYLDMLGIYKTTAETYLIYKPILQEQNPDANKLIQDRLNEMYALLQEWRALNAISQLTEIDTNSPDFHAKRRQIIFELAKYMEGN